MLSLTMGGLAGKGSTMETSDAGNGVERAANGTRDEGPMRCGADFVSLDGIFDERE